MDQQDGFSANLFKWDLRGSSLTAAASTPLPPYRIVEAAAPPAASYGGSMMMSHHQLHMQSSSTVRAAHPLNQSTMSLNLTHQLGGLEELFQPYGIRYYTASKIAELGFTVNTLVDMKEEELDDMINSLSHIFRWDLLVGERYGIKAAVRAERRRLQELEYSRTHSLNNIMSADTTTTHPLDAFSQKALSEERMNNPQAHDKEVVGSGGGAWEMVAMQQQQLHQQQQQQHQQERKKQKQQQRRKKNNNVNEFEDGEEEDDDDELDDGSKGGGSSSSISERQREHPFIVTEPGEVARGKKNGLDYLFHLYELCRDFLIQVQNLAKDSGDKCPTKVTNQVFRYAKKAGATYINKPKMRHYVHCYALHCLDEETSNALRKAYKERGENVGAWRQACYKPLVSIAGGQGWDIDAIFNAHPRLCIWYVPTKLRQLCHAERSSAAAAATTANRSAAAHHLPF